MAQIIALIVVVVIVGFVLHPAVPLAIGGWWLERKKKKEQK